MIRMAALRKNSWSSCLQCLLSLCLSSAFALVTRDTYKAGQVSAVPNIDWMRLHGSGQNQQSSLPVRDPNDQNVHPVLPYPGSRQGVSHWADHHGQLWMMGGWGFDGSGSEQPKFLNDVWLYDSARDKWKCLRDSETSSAAPDPRHSGASCGVHATGFVVYAGSGLNSKAYNDTWVYEISNATWLKILGGKDTPPGRSDPVHWCLRDSIVIYGGLDVAQKSLSDLWMFSFKDVAWKRLEQGSVSKNSDGTDLMPNPRHGAAAWAHSRDKLFMFGGRNSNGYLSDMWVYSLKEKSWTLVHDKQKPETGTLGIPAADVFPPASAHHATWLDAKFNLILFGGENPSLLPDLWQFNTATSQWMWLGRQSLPVYKQSQNTKNFPSARSHGMSWSFKNVMYLLGGYVLDLQNNTALSNEMFVLTKDNVTYFFSTDDKWLHLMPASTIFIIILSTFTGIALTIGAGFFIKKTFEHPRHKNGEFDVRYSPLAQETTLEM